MELRGNANLLAVGCSIQVVDCGGKAGVEVAGLWREQHAAQCSWGCPRELGGQGNGYREGI